MEAKETVKTAEKPRASLVDKIKERGLSPHWTLTENPRRSVMYKSIRRLNAFMFITLVITAFYLQVGPENQRQAMPLALYEMFAIFFMVYLVFWNKANQVLVERSHVHEENEKCLLKKVDNFPGWALIIFGWYVAWLNGLLLIYDVYLLGELDVFGFKFTLLTTAVIFDRTTWGVILLPFTAIFVVSDSIKSKLAAGAEGAFQNFIEKLFLKLRGALGAAVDGWIQAGKEPPNS